MTEAEQRPYDDRGRFISKTCTDPFCDGELQYEGDHWRCDGLVDPPRVDQELQACARIHFDGSALEEEDKRDG